MRRFQAAHGYTPRTSQDEMFLRTEARFADGHPIVGVEAPTGTGKSMQLISRAVSLGRSYRRIIVATHTRSQADQYRKLAEQAVRHGLADSWHVLYGSSEYLCPMRRSTHGLSHVNAGDSDGSRQGLAGLGVEFTEEEWALSNHVSEECDRDECDDYYYAARDAAANSSRSIVFMTHARVALEAVIGNRVFEFSSGDHLIIDEAHRFPSVLRETFGATLTDKKMDALLKRSDGPVERQLFDAARTIREFLDDVLLAEGAEYTQIADRSAFHAALSLLTSAHVQSHRRARVLMRRRRELELLADEGMHAFIRHGHHLQACVPDLDVAANLRRVAGTFDSNLLMSATLCGIPAEDMGLDDPVKVPSAFNLSNNRRLVTRAGSDGEEAKVKYLVELVKENGGRTLVICKSSNVRYQGSLEPQHLLYARLLVERGLRVGLQRSSADVPKLRQSLIDGEVEVVIGLASVREGFDVPGDPLTLVVLAQLPWPYMADPILAARIHDDGDAWRIPCEEMELNTRQAVGRLCRTPEDTGQVVLLDSRPRSINTFLRLAQMDVNDDVA